MSLANNNDQEFIIQKMSPDDVEAATIMRQQSWLDTYINDDAGVTREWIEMRNKEQMTPERNAKRQEGLKNPNNAAWVAKDMNGEVIGATTPYRDDDGTQHIGSLYVKKEWHGKGVASALMQKAMDWFDLSQSIILGVASYNIRAQSFYKKWGFEKIPDSEALHNDKIPEFKMLYKGELK